MKYTIAVYFDEPGKLDYPFTEPGYQHSYQKFSEFCHRNDTELVIVRGQSYQGNMTFSSGWRFEGEELIEIEGPIKVDLIYVKGINFVLQTDPTDLVFNDPAFDRAIRDKWGTYQTFSDFMAKSHLLSHDNWEIAKKELKSDKIVLKPIASAGGKGIVIVEREQFHYPSLKLEGPYIAQEFIDSSSGIPGLVDGLHDLRVIVFDGKPTLSFIRTPASGKLLSNVALGGSARVIDISLVPDSVVELVKRIDTHYSNFSPRIYTADFFMSEGKPYLIETNARPGFPLLDEHGEHYASSFYESLHNVLTRAIDNRRSQL